jgi:hypothetical protein
MKSYKRYYYLSFILGEHSQLGAGEGLIFETLLISLMKFRLSFSS